MILFRDNVTAMLLSSLIRIVPSLTRTSSEVCFYKIRDNIYLSRSGTRRLLGTINGHIQIVDNFECCAYPDRQPFVRGNRPAAGHVARNNQQSRGNGISEGNHRRRPRPPRFNNRSAEDRYEDRCMKCGLRNHVTVECRHKTQIQCFHCKFYGHKDLICWNL